jgi:hypothetical protein
MQKNGKQSGDIRKSGKLDKVEKVEKVEKVVKGTSER